MIMIRTGRRLSGAAGVVLEGLDVLRHRAVVAAVVDQTKQKQNTTKHTTQQRKGKTTQMREEAYLL